jgi:hypothetical protein
MTRAGTSVDEPTTCMVVSDPQRKTLTMFSTRMMSAAARFCRQEQQHTANVSAVDAPPLQAPRPIRSVPTFEARRRVLRLEEQLLLKRELLLQRRVRLVIVLGAHAVAVAVEDENRLDARRRYLCRTRTRQSVSRPASTRPQRPHRRAVARSAPPRTRCVALRAGASVASPLTLAMMSRFRSPESIQSCTGRGWRMWGDAIGRNSILQPPCH